MNLIITALKVKLEPFGWTEIVQRGGKKGNAPNVCGNFIEGEGGDVLVFWATKYIIWQGSCRGSSSHIHKQILSPNT